jgi:integrase
MAHVRGTYEGQPLEYRSLSVRIRRVKDLLGTGGDGSIHEADHWIWDQIVRYINADEYQPLLTAAEKIRWYLLPVIEIAANTGLRRGNIFQLRWDECDRKAGVIRKAKTKNNEAVAIPMNAAVVAVLDEFEERRNGSLYVFPHMQGEQEGEAIKDVKNSFRTALKKAKIENFRFHDLRHCCASWLMMNGADLNDVRQILEHRSIAMTLRYAHLSPRYLADKVKLLEKTTLPNSCQMQDATRSNSEQDAANRNKEEVRLFSVRRHKVAT